MPLQAFSPNAGGAYLYAGISGAGDSVGEGITRMGQNLRQAKAYRAMAVDALGMDPDEVDKMGLGELTGHVQAAGMKATMQQHAALAQQEMAKAAMMQNQVEESDAMGRLGPALASLMAGQGGGGAPAAGQNPADMGGDVDPGQEMGPASAGGPAAMMGVPGGGTGTRALDPALIMQAMSSMGPTSSRVQAAMWRNLMPQLMGGEQMGPQSWTDPATGAHFARMGKTLMRSENPDVINSLMGAQQVPGYSMVQTAANKLQALPIKERTPGPAFDAAIGKLTGDIYDAQSRLSTPDAEMMDSQGKPLDAATIKARRASAQRVLQSATAQVKRLVDSHHTLKNLTDEQRDTYYSDLGLGGGGSAAAGAGKGAEGTQGTKGTDRVTVSKGGKVFNIPASQVDQAKKAGYTVGQ
jgi:hypothetical protein